MRTLGNILWHIPFLGFLDALLAFLIGGLLTLTVAGAPIGLGLIQLSKFLLKPFSSVMIKKDLKINKDTGSLRAAGRILWRIFSFIVRIIYFPIGLILAIIAIVQIVASFATIVGIPVAIVIAKSLGTYFNPVNKICVPITNLTINKI